MTVPSCTIDATGIHAPSFDDVLAYLQSQYRAIYGSDVYLGNDSQDGQLLGIFADAINDCNSQTVSVYAEFSPQTAQGTGLSSVVKINGIARKIPSRSTVDLLVVGQAGTIITNGQAQDSLGNKWTLPTPTTIPFSGEITVTAAAALAGEVLGPANTINEITTPTRGWQSVNNPANAEPGAPVESDADLRVRQSYSTALPSQTVLDGMIGSVASVTGVSRYRAYENDIAATDANGIPSHTVSFVVDGGDAQAIADAIALKKAPGVGTYGTTSETVTDEFGIPHTIRFFRPTEVPITVGITIDNLPGYTTAIGTRVTAAVVDYINGLQIGETVYYTRLYVPANLSNNSEGATFELVSVQISRDGNPVAPADVVIAFNEAATCTADNVTLAVV